MRVVIFEDEQIAGEKLKYILQSLRPEIEVLAIIPSIEMGQDFLQKNEVDLGFFDIHLEDGLSFALLEKLPIDFPVIFTTAYDRYAIQAFKHHSIDYLLKPIQKTDVAKALEKFAQLTNTFSYEKLQNLSSKQLSEESYSESYKERFTVKIGDRIKIIPTGDIACFYSRAKGSFLLTTSGKSYLLEQSLETILSKLSPDRFFKVNRKHIVRIDQIDSLIQFSNSRQKVVLPIAFDEDIIVAREKVKLFKTWLEGK